MPGNPEILRDELIRNLLFENRNQEGNLFFPSSEDSPREESRDRPNSQGHRP
jgi:hypothetical protein